MIDAKSRPERPIDARVVGVSCLALVLGAVATYLLTGPFVNLIYPLNAAGFEGKVVAVRATGRLVIVETTDGRRLAVPQGQWMDASPAAVGDDVAKAPGHYMVVKGKQGRGGSQPVFNPVFALFWLGVLWLGVSAVLGAAFIFPWIRRRIAEPPGVLESRSARVRAGCVALGLGVLASCALVNPMRYLLHPWSRVIFEGKVVAIEGKDSGRQFVVETKDRRRVMIPRVDGNEREPRVGDEVSKEAGWDFVETKDTRGNAFTYGGPIFAVALLEWVASWLVPSVLFFLLMQRALRPRVRAASQGLSTGDARS